VLKLIHRGAGGDTRWPASDDPGDPYWWRREELAYTSGTLTRLEPALRAPALKHRVQRPDGTLALWLEHVPEVERWTPELLGAFASRLGRAQAKLAIDSPDEPWLARGFLRRYLDLHGVVDREGVLERLERLPHTLTHNDLHPANVLGEDASVVVDWAYCGLAPLGLDAGVLVADGVADELIAIDEADAVAAAVWDGYARGLADGGYAGDVDDVRWALLRGTALRLAWLDPGRSPAWHATVELLGRWCDEAEEIPSAG
jgi:hypothetical protein